MSEKGYILRRETSTPSYNRLMESVLPLIEFYSKALQKAGIELTIGHELTYMDPRGVAELISGSGKNTRSANSRLRKFLWRQNEITSSPVVSSPQAAGVVDGLDIHGKRHSTHMLGREDYSHVDSQTSFSLKFRGHNVTVPLAFHIKESYKEIASIATPLVIPHPFSGKYSELADGYNHAVSWIGSGCDVKIFPNHLDESRIELRLPSALSSPAVNHLFALMIVYNALFENGKPLITGSSKSPEINLSELNNKFPYAESAAFAPLQMRGLIPNNISPPEPPSLDAHWQQIGGRMMQEIPNSYKELHDLLDGEKVTQMLTSAVEHSAPEGKKEKYLAAANNLIPNFKQWAEENYKQNPLPELTPKGRWSRRTRRPPTPSGESGVQNHCI